MKHLSNPIGAYLSAALLAACGGGNGGFSASTPMSVKSQIGAPESAAAGSAGPGYKVLYSFGSGADGQYPEGSLTLFRGRLYGTTAGGGGALGDGTLFRISTAGAEHVLHSFNGVDGASPTAALTVLGGTLYGTTAGGGAGSCDCGPSSARAARVRRARFIASRVSKTARISWQA